MVGGRAGSDSATAAGPLGFALGTETLGSMVSPSPLFSHKIVTRRVRGPWIRGARPATPIRFPLEAEAAFDDVSRNGEVRTLKGQTPNSWPNTFRGSRLVPAAEYIRAWRWRTNKPPSGAKCTPSPAA
jgi:hypothetical protein